MKIANWFVLGIVIFAIVACSSSVGGGTAATAPNAPSTLAAVAVSSGGISLTWTDGSDNEEGFKVERSADGVTFTEVGTVTANIAVYSETGLAASTRYYYRVCAYNSAENSAYTNIADATTQTPPATAPAAPTDLSAAAASSTAINLNWTDASSNEEGFKIERSISATSGFTEISIVAANGAGYSDINLTPSTTYYYKVKAYNSAGDSAYTATASAATQASPITAPTAPTNLVISSSTSTQINLAWTDTSSDETGFKIETSTDGSTFSQLATVGANVVAYSDTGLTPSTPYYYKVRAYNSAGNSSYSNTANATTQASPAVALSTVTAFYPTNGANWNDYVKNDDADIYSASDTACTGAETGGYSVCLHGGEMRTVTVAGKTSCTGLTATDSLGAFNWICSDSTGTAQFISTGLKDGKYLSDLLDFTTPGWKANSVTVNDGTSLYSSASSTTWWTNPIVVDNDGGSLTAPGTIYTVTSNVTGTYTLDASKIALVSKPGVTISGPGAGSGSSVIAAISTSTRTDFLWFEVNVNATGDDVGVYLEFVRFAVLRGVKADNAHVLVGSGSHNHGVLLNVSNNNKLISVSASNNYLCGVVLLSSNFNTLASIAASNNSYDGIVLSNSTNNMLTSITAMNNVYEGVKVWYSSNNTLTSVTAANNRYGVYLNASTNNKLNSVAASNNYYNGVYLYSSSNNNTLTSVTAANNGSAGIYLESSSNNTLTSITAANNPNYGVYLGSSSNNTLASVSAVNTGAYGISLYLSTDNKFTGLLQVGTNSTSNCYVNGGTNPGLVDGTCVNQGSSDSTLVTGVSLSSSFVGKVTTDDTVNASDTNGSADYVNTTDWTGFQNPFRSWGLDGTFGLSNSRGQWTTGAGRIWDWSLASGDTVIRDVLSLPTGTSTLTHTWSDALTTTFLRNAVELSGNGNGLCESGETCLFTPNIGAYQGHGNLISAGAFTDGTIIGVTLMKYENNGR